jgi:hypothetical protein
MKMGGVPPTMSAVLTTATKTAMIIESAMVTFRS